MMKAIFCTILIIPAVLFCLRSMMQEKILSDKFSKKAPEGNFLDRCPISKNFGFPVELCKSDMLL